MVMQQITVHQGAKSMKNNKNVVEFAATSPIDEADCTITVSRKDGKPLEGSEAHQILTRFLSTMKQVVRRPLF